jgi:hypothetical protein
MLVFSLTAYGNTLKSFYKKGNALETFFNFWKQNKNKIEEQKSNKHFNNGITA